MFSMRWLKEKTSKLLDEIFTGVIIALILSALTSGWYLVRGNITNLPVRSLIIFGIVVIIIAAFISVFSMRKKRSKSTSGFNLSAIQNDRIENLFTGRKDEIDIFDKNVLNRDSYHDAKFSTVKILWFFGMGGVGKSWLLEKFTSLALSRKLPVASIGCEKENQIANILRVFSEQLKQQGLYLEKFERDLATYLRIQASLQETALKTSGQLARIITSTIGEIGIPGVSPIAKAVGPESVGQLIDSLRSQMSEDDAKLYLEPQGQLTSSFIEDIKKVSLRKRIVIIFDTFEQAEKLDSWVSELTEKILSSNVVVVVASRTPPSLYWNNLLSSVQIFELKTMQESDALECLRRYQGEQPIQEISVQDLKEIYRFSKGLPLALSLSM